MATQLDPTSTSQTTGETEPMLLLDTTGSMDWAAAAGSSVKRRSVVGEAIVIVVEALGAEDSQAAHEEGGGGLMCVTFADGTAHKLGDLNSRTLETLWNSITWGGETWVLPGYEKALSVFHEEFPTTPRPTLRLLTITDGEAKDTDRFVSRLAQNSDGDVYVEVGIIGHGVEHDRALAAYQRVAARNPRVSVTSFDSQTDPQVLADALLKMIA